MVDGIGNKNKIAIICPYFGTLPSNYKYTLASMAANEFIDWYIITDDYVDDKMSSNIFVINTKFEEIQKRIKSILGVDIRKVYKLCDYKPLYGVLFDDILSKYDYWGYSDLDILYGDLKNCLSTNNLLAYDKILELGHLSVYKNDSSINNICKNIENEGLSLQSILNSDEIYVLDESYGENHLSVNELLDMSGYSVLRRVEGCKDIISRYRNLHIAGEHKQKYTYLKYKNGKLYIKNWKNNDSREITYAHFQKRQFKVLAYSNTKEYAVTPKGFFDEKTINRRCFYSKIIDLRLWWYIKLRINRWFGNKRTKY